MLSEKLSIDAEFLTRQLFPFGLKPDSSAEFKISKILEKLIFGSLHEN